MTGGLITAWRGEPPVRERKFMSRHLLGAVIFGAVTLVCSTSSKAQQWVFCASEGEVCGLDGVGVFRFGADENWTYGVGTDGQACSTSTFFGQDPAPGALKTCQRWEAADETGRNQSTDALQARFDQAQKEIAALREQVQYVGELEAEVSRLEGELRRFQRSDRRSNRRSGRDR